MPTLYATPGGKRYHSQPACIGLNSWAVAWCNTIDPPTVTRAQAVRRGLTPCKACQPAPLLSVVA